MVSCSRMWIVGLGLLIAVLGGCSDRTMEKVVVRGTVRFDGAPIPHGQIRFIPIDGTKGPVSGNVIQDGKYIVQGKGGVPLGSHRVEITAYRPIKGNAPAAVQAEGGPSEQYLPGKYNGRSKLAATITAESGSHPLDFDLEP